MSYFQLDHKKTITTVSELNILLANYQLYYQKLRNFHWNVVGNNFFQLHIKFEELYNDALLKIDEIAERILTLRHQPLSNYSDYLKESSILEPKSNLTDIEMVQSVIEDHNVLLHQLRKVANAANNAEDDGTNDIVGGYIRDLEKVSWMLEAYTKTINTVDGTKDSGKKAAKEKHAKKK